MIDLKELRIGNWIWIDLYDGLQFPVSYHKFLLGDFEQWKNNLYKDRCNYVELTPKILERFGFEKLNNVDYRLPFNNSYLEIDTYDKEFWNLQLYKMPVPLIKPCIYLHQLQNLFFALTGIELNDIVAHNYYLKLHKELKWFGGSLSLESFIKTIESSDLRATSICEKMPEYNLGDLPKDLFS